MLPNSEKWLQNAEAQECSQVAAHLGWSFLLFPWWWSLLSLSSRSTKDQDPGVKSHKRRVWGQRQGVCALQVNVIVALQWEISSEFLSISLENTFAGFSVARGLRSALTFSAVLSPASSIPLISFCRPAITHSRGSSSRGALCYWKLLWCQKDLRSKKKKNPYSSGNHLCLLMVSGLCVLTLLPWEELPSPPLCVHVCAVPWKHPKQNSAGKCLWPIHPRVSDSQSHVPRWQMLTLGFAPATLCSWAVDLCSCQPRFARDCVISAPLFFLSICWVGEEMSFSHLATALRRGWDNTRWEMFLSSLWSGGAGRPKGHHSQCCSGLPVSVHRSLAAEGCQAARAWEGSQVNTWARMLPWGARAWSGDGSRGGPAPGPAPAEGLRVPASESWSCSKQPRCRLIRGTAELPGSGVQLPGASGFGLAVEQGKELPGAAQVPCAALLTCFAQRGCRWWLFLCASCRLRPAGAQGRAREDAQRRRDFFSRSWVRGQRLEHGGARLVPALLSLEDGVWAGTSSGRCEQQEQSPVLVWGILLWMDALSSWHGWGLLFREGFAVLPWFAVLALGAVAEVTQGSRDLLLTGLELSWVGSSGVSWDSTAPTEGKRYTMCGHAGAVGSLQPPLQVCVRKKWAKAFFFALLRKRDSFSGLAIGAFLVMPSPSPRERNPSSFPFPGTWNALKLRYLPLFWRVELALW